MSTPQFVLDLRKKIGHAEALNGQPSGLTVAKGSGHAATGRDRKDRI